MRDASAAQITGNAEIQAIKQILGLQHGKVYTDAKSLRYGHLMIMTDQVGACWGACQAGGHGLDGCGGRHALGERRSMGCLCCVPCAPYTPC